MPKNADKMSGKTESGEIIEPEGRMGREHTIELRKTGANGATLVWRAEVLRNEVHYVYGQEGGKMQTEEKVYSEGKNVGRANETTADEQCLFEACRKARKKVEKGYKPVVGGHLIAEQKSATVVDHDDEVPFCMLAQSLKDHLKKLRARHG